MARCTRSAVSSLSQARRSSTPTSIAPSSSSASTARTEPWASCSIAVSDVTVADAVPPIADLVGDGAIVHVGGPVQPQAVVVLADFVEPHRASALVLDTIGFLPGDVDDETDLGELRSVRVYAGYAGWGAGQLEDELDEQSWVVLPARPRTSSRTCPTRCGRRSSAGTGVRSASSRSSRRTRTSTDMP